MEDKNHPRYIALDSLKEQSKPMQEQKQEHEYQELNQQLKEDQKEHYKDFINKMEVRKQLDNYVFNINLAYKQTFNLNLRTKGDVLDVIAFKPPENRIRRHIYNMH